MRSFSISIVIPYPGTPLWKECREKDWLLSEDYEDYDMRKPVMKCPLSDGQVLELTQDLYKAFLSPQFIWRQLTSIKNLDDIEYYLSAFWRFIGHLTDFSPKQLSA